MYLKRIAVAGLLAAASFSSFAALTPSDLGTLTTTGKSFSSIVGPGSFEEVLTFSVGPSFATSGGITSFNFFDFSGLTDFKFVYTSGTTLFGPFTGSGPVSLGNLAAGMYTGTFSGSSTTGGYYAGALRVTPVPEPETLALMLAGLGAIGLMVRRRNAG